MSQDGKQPRARSFRSISSDDWNREFVQLRCHPRPDQLFGSIGCHSTLPAALPLIYEWCLAMSRQPRVACKAVVVADPTVSSGRTPGRCADDPAWPTSVARGHDPRKPSERPIAASNVAGPEKPTQTLPHPTLLATQNHPAVRQHAAYSLVWTDVRRSSPKDLRSPATALVPQIDLGTASNIPRDRRRCPFDDGHGIPQKSNPPA